MHYFKESLKCFINFSKSSIPKNAKLHVDWFSKQRVTITTQEPTHTHSKRTWVC